MRALNHAHRVTRNTVARLLGAVLVTAFLLAALAPAGGDSQAAWFGGAGDGPASAPIDPALLEAAESIDGGGAEAPDTDTADIADPDDTAWVHETSGTVEVFVFFDDPGVAPAAQGDPELAAASLQRNADEHWVAVDRALEPLERAGRIEVLNRFWVTNAVLLLAESSEETLDELSRLPGATSVTPNFTVEGLDEEAPIVAAEPSVPSATVTEVSGDETALPITYGIDKINADDVWRDFGAEGQGVRVAVLDTGVDARHPDLASRMVGRDSGDLSYPGGWINFDRTGTPIVSRPTDPGSHGTHVAGTIVGGGASGTRIGVAPQAELMAANVLSGGGSGAKIMAALQWVIEPYDGQGNPAGRAADVINMSLGSSGYDASLIRPLQNLRDAGIFPAIAIGNASCGPNGTSNPGDIYEAFGVGMTDADDEVNAGSCGAVTNWPASTAELHGWPANFVKPDASAPGTAVFSSMPSGAWGNATGTSMATPHVAGAVALLRSAQGGLTIDEIEAALEGTAWHPNPGSGPDTRYGHGRIDVLAAVSSVLGEAGVKGQVLDAATGEPVIGAEISYGEHGETWVTDAQGRFTARLTPGAYTLEITRFGYESASTAEVRVAESGFQSLEGDSAIRLTPITVGSIAGTVVDFRDGTPIAGATVTVMGQPITTETAADGSYRFIDLPIGGYRIRVDSPGMRESISGEAPVQAALSTTVNFQLAALPKVLVLGDNGGRTAAILAENGLDVESLASLPADMGLLAGYDAVLWDTPVSDTPVTAAQLQSVITATDASPRRTGIVWLDLGASDGSGIASLSLQLGSPAVRTGASSRDLTATGYRITAEHPIFAGGALSAEALAPGSLLLQDTNSDSGARKFTAWFDQLTGTSPTVLGETISQHKEGENHTVTTTLGSGIAVDQRANNRHAFLALHGSSAAVDARSWSLASQQLLINTVSWVAPADTQAPEPEIILPTVPVIPPGDGGNGSRPQSTGPAAASPLSSLRSTRAPTTQAAAKPERTPDAPVSEFNQLTARNSGDVTVREEGGVAHVTIPGSKPGDWFYLHVYPGALAVDWIRVNDDGELRIDIARLPSGTYRLAFTDSDGEFVGWAEIVVAGSAATTASTIEQAIEGETPGSSGSGFSLSLAEQIMLLGAALILLAAAGVVLMAMRRPTPTPSPGEAGSGGAS